MFGELLADLVQFSLALFVGLGLVLEEGGVVGKQLVDGFVG